MSILLDKMCEAVEIGSVKYEIVTDFRTWIEFETIMQSELENDDKIFEALQLIFPVLPSDLSEAINLVLWFYRCGKEPPVYIGGKNQSDIYSYEQDDKYIYAAFLEQYEIDLQTVDYMHWWKFKSLFDSLKSDTQIVKIMSYRATDTNGMSKSNKAFYNEIKKTYALKQNSRKKSSYEEYKQNMLNYVNKRFEETGY